MIVLVVPLRLKSTALVSFMVFSSTAYHGLIK